MTRTVTGGVATILGGEHVWVGLLIELQFASGTAFLTNVPHDLVWNGNTYLGCAGITINEMRETAVPEVVGLQLGVTGTLAPFISLALDESAHSRGKPARIYAAFFDANQRIVADPVLEWDGFMDTMQISDSGGQTQIVVNCENRYAAFARPKIRRHSLADHQIDYPDDLFYEFVAAMVDKPIIWPSREWFKIRGR